MKKLHQRGFAVYEVLLVLIVIGVIAAIGFGVAKQKGRTLVYASPTQKTVAVSGVKITLPSGWAQIATQQGDIADFTDTNANYAVADVGGTPQTLVPTIQIASSPTGSTDLAATLTSVTNYNAAHLTSYKLEDTETLSLGGVPAHLVAYSFSQGNIHATSAELITIKGSTTYYVNAESLASVWAQHGQAMTNALTSFQP
jgi:prepilin-type N-terminal cleavage/methylation domain-containing protein